MTIVFQVIKHTIGLRASREEEVRGLDVTEHNLTSSYADFMPMPPEILTGKSTLGYYNIGDAGRDESIIR